MIHYQVINEKATLLQCFWINIQVTFEVEELFLCSSEQNKAYFQQDSSNSLRESGGNLRDRKEGCCLQGNLVTAA